MTIKEIQKKQKEWEVRNFGEQGVMDSFLGVVEEVGELAHALLKQKQGIRGTYDENEEKAKDAIGDAMIFMMGLCSKRGWDLEDIVSSTWAEVEKRDWTNQHQLRLEEQE